MEIPIKGSSASIYINPKFKSAHINPNFLPKNPLHNVNNSSSNSTVTRKGFVTNIHINPKFKNAHINPNFLQKPLDLSASTFHIDIPNHQNMNIEKSLETQPKAKILTKTKTKLIRESKTIDIFHKSSGQDKKSMEPSIIHVGRRKLIRVPLPRQSIAKQSTTNRRAAINKLPKKTIQTKYKIVKGIQTNLYKIDRRRLAQQLRVVVRTPRILDNSNLKLIPQSRSMLSPTRMIITDRKLFRIGLPNQKYITKSAKYKTMFNKKLELLNINGVLYRSTRTKLQKQLAASTTTPSLIATLNRVKNISTMHNPIQRTKTLFVRGEKFILNASGNCLTKVYATNPTIQLRRIDIGGLTYIAKSDANIYERTDRHTTQVHLTMAKYRSINVLAKNRVKSNVVCAIFRKLGKCIGYERGRCTRIHDKRHVAVCPKFLKGTCAANNCLLSHNVSLAKMPTCKFFLQGICTKIDCPYLHKKVNDKVGFCRNFLNGYCEKADKCDQRHDFETTAITIKTSSGKQKVISKKIINTISNTSGDRINAKQATEDEGTTITTETNSRYFYDVRNNNDDNETNKKKLSRILSKIDKVKANLNLCPGMIDAAVANETMKKEQFESSKQISSLNATAEHDDELPLLPIERIKCKRPKLGTLPSFIPLG